MMASQTPTGTGQPRWGSSTAKSMPSRGSSTPRESRKKRNSEHQQRARSTSLARKGFLAMDKKQLVKECKKLRVSVTGSKGDMVHRLMEKQKDLASPKAKPAPKSPKTWKSDAHIISPYGLKDRTSSKKKKTKRSATPSGDDDDDEDISNAFLGTRAQTARSPTTKKKKRKVQ